MTTHIRPGYVRKNGVPFSEDAVLEEFYDVIKDANGVEWLIVTSKFTDPMYLEPAVHFQYALQKGTQRCKVEPDSVYGEIARCA